MLAERLDPLEILITDHDRLHRQATPGRILDDLAPQAVGELVMGDPKQPRGKPLVKLAPAAQAGQRGGEYFGHQIGREVAATHPPNEVRQHRRLVAAIQLPERIRRTLQRIDKRSIVEIGQAHT